MYRNQSTPHSFNDRIAEQKKLLEAEIGRAPPDRVRDLEKKLRQLDVASHLNEWLSSPGLQSPR